MAGKWRSINGVLLFDKPLELSSNIALQKVRRLFQAEKAGHTGTLDPLATGLLPVCFGEATKFSIGLLEADKTYLAQIKLYVRTLAEDIGHALGCGAHLIGLRRTQIAGFSLKSAYSLPQLEAMTSAERDACLLPLDCMLLDLPRLDLDSIQVGRLAQGQRLGLDLPYPDGKLRLYAEGEFIGLADFSGRRLAPSRLISSVAQNAARCGGVSTSMEMSVPSLPL